MKRHEIPTHLDAPDRFLFGLTAKQAMQLMAAAASMYGLLNNEVLPPEVRLPLAIVSVLVGVLVALVRPDGRAVEEWLVLLAFHVATPRQFVWRPVPFGADWETDTRWANLRPRLDWASDPTEGSHAR
jgi:hypothetical protein